MKRFVFSLQKVLDLREFEKKQAEAELGRAVGEETRIENSLKSVAESRAATVRAADNMRNLSDLYNANRYFALLDQQKEQLLEELTQAKLVTEEKREAMREAMKKQKVLEKLKEKRLASWKKEALKEEESTVDDIVTGQFERS
ncbi:MAG: flagellar export protein FliJ [Treponema sp.]|nr:flagellar export protein FliJ [Treponema sp.]